MSTKISDELKKAIKNLPEAEKDKLLLRLIAKDRMLIAKLNHELLEDEVDAEAQRETLARQLEAHFSAENFAAWNHTPGLVMMEQRSFSGAITRHVKITKDKYGEIQLTVLLVNMPFRAQSKILYHNQHRADTFAPYVCKKAQDVFKKLKKLDRDYYVEFEKDVNEMLDHLRNYPPTKSLMKEYQLPERWEF
jgi:hypothetical protein